MIHMDNEKVAELLDLVAVYVDENEHQKEAAERSARDTRISRLAESYEATTGESLPTQLTDKLATLDQDALDHLLKIANNKSESPTSLGGPAQINDHPEPRNVKEAATRAEDNFLNWIIND